MRANFLIIIMSALLLVGAAPTAHGQYFGRNKPNYATFKFRVLQTPSFEIYHYMNNPERIQALAEDAEVWFKLHQAILDDTIKGRNPLIIYNDHADFQQTNTILGEIGVGTGGVTEAFRNRVVMPFAMSNQQTHHVLGHELVHAYQYNMILNGDSTSLRNLGNLPLWLVEGLAEYLSIGSIDPNTAMWMRDAVQNDRVPTLRELNNPQFFPYRYGQTFWVFLTGMFGDEVIKPFFVNTAKYGLEIACQLVLGMREKDLSKLWVDTLKSHFGKFVDDKKEKAPGLLIVSGGGPGRLNIAPVLSPNGKYVIFLSERDLFSIDLYLADATTGKIERKIGGTLKDGHLDNISYIESAGSWSPKGDEFVFVGIQRGRNVLVFKNAENGRTIRTVAVPGVPAFTNPAWSPDGRKILFPGLVEGQIDLYTYEIRTGKVERLTNDVYAEIMPAWSADGTQIVFSTDELSMKRGRTHGKWKHNIAIMDAVSGRITHIDVFVGADNLNAQFDPQGDILFLSDRNGYRNLYRYDVLNKKVYQLTDSKTGITGITPFAPAFSIDRKRNRIAYTHYMNGAYSIYKARPEDFLNEEVDPSAVDWAAATLPRINRQASKLVDQAIRQIDDAQSLSVVDMIERPYRPKFRLDYVGGGAGVGVGTSNLFGASTGGAGGVDMFFSDIVGNNKIFSTLAINGEIQDFGGIVSYLNSKSRMGWGVSASHFPAFFVEGFQRALDTVSVGGQPILALRESIIAQRLFESRGGFFSQYPFSTTLRVEGGANIIRYGFSRRRYDSYYDVFGRFLGEQRSRLEAPEGFNLYSFSAALVGDNSSFGVTSPLAGQRFRVGVNQFLGAVEFTNITIDYRRYLRVKPVTFAFRAMHDGRYGNDPSRIFPLFIISPWYIRGYSDFLGVTNTQEIINRYQLDVEDYRASKVLVGNAEIRLPFTGPKRLALIPNGFFMSDLSLFVDGGMAFNELRQVFGNVEEALRPRLLASVGASLRVNLFGAMIVEPFYAIPVGQRLAPGERNRGSFGVNLMPGW